MDFPKLTKQQEEKDSYVIGAIIAGIRSRKKKLKPGLAGMETPEGLCAVGAGNRGLKIAQPSDIVTKAWLKKKGHAAIYSYSSTTLHQLIPLIRFSTAMGVTENYTCGVNDGFEDIKAAVTFYPYVDMDSLDYLRGWNVGQVIRSLSGY